MNYSMIMGWCKNFTPGHEIFEIFVEFYHNTLVSYLRKKNVWNVISHWAVSMEHQLIWEFLKVELLSIYIEAKFTDFWTRIRRNRIIHELADLKMEASDF